MAAINRYARSPVLNLGTQFGTSRAIAIIRNAVKSGELKVREQELRGRERLDTIAGSVYGDGRLWWILAATSDVGWGLQVPVGTIIKVPDLGDISRLVG
jgi:hypothetical protein